MDIIHSWEEIFQSSNVRAIILQNNEQGHKGCGFGRNVAVANCTGTYICFLDADDLMHESRVQLQLQAAVNHPNSIIGSNFERTPALSTQRYTQWCNSLSNSQLILHQYRECTVVQPTWFMSKVLFTKVGGYDETGPGTPEDLIYSSTDIWISAADFSKLMYPL